MLILLSCAKTMVPASKTQAPLLTKPCFEDKAQNLAMHMAGCSVGELERMLHVNAKIAIENFHRYQVFFSVDNRPLQALLAYTGIVFKRLNPKDFSEDDFRYAQDHLRITSFCYGLLRPLDGIRCYRLEGDVRLPEWGGQTVFDYWKDVLTDALIHAVLQQGGVLVNLASEEMKSLFHWSQVEDRVKVITPTFQVEKNGRLKTVVVYTKMARGEMTRYLLKNRIEQVEDLCRFSFDGFAYRPDLSDDHTCAFVMAE